MKRHCGALTVEQVMCLFERFPFGKPSFEGVCFESKVAAKSGSEDRFHHQPTSIPGYILKELAT